MLSVAMLPASATASPTATTTLRFFQPSSSVGLTSATKVTATAAGYCWTSSLQVADPSAYRCLEKSEILDLCYASPFVAHVTSVACGDPWSGVVLLRLTKVLPKVVPDQEVFSRVGWLLELANGRRCHLADGATGSIDGVRVAYLCGASSVAGQLRWSVQPWHVAYVAKGGKEAIQVRVVLAWGA